MRNTRIFDELTDVLGWVENINENNLAKLILKNKSEVKNILEQDDRKLYKNQDWKTSWYLFFAEFREHLWIQKYMDLDTFNAFTEVVMISWDDLDYDDFLKIFKKSKALSKTKSGNSSYKWVNVSKIIENQWEYLAQWLVELVANGIDATIVDKTIWRFWEGFYQSLKYLKWWNSEILVQTKKEWEKWFQINIKNESWVNKIWSVWIDKENNWTKIELKKKLSLEEQKDLEKFLKSRFKTNKKTKIILNGELVNSLTEYNYHNWKELNLPQQEVNIEISENGFKVIDSWVWMSSRDLSEKLLAPNMSGKKRLNSDSMTDKEIEKHTKNETAFFYKNFNDWKEILKNNELKTKKTDIRLQVGWVLIEEFHTETSYDIEEFCLELPSFTWLPESRNKIELTKEVVVSLEMTMEKISNQISSQKEQLMLLEIVAKIIKHLKSRESSNSQTKSKYDINRVAKKSFKKIKEEIESSWKTVIASIPGIKDILDYKEDVVFVDEELLKFDIRKIPWIKKLANIKDKQKDFYEIEFWEKAKYDYLILDNAILVNSKYTKSQDDLDKINAQVNLNLSYEKEEDRVFYGIIENEKEENSEPLNRSYWRRINNEEKEQERMKITKDKLQEIIDDFEYVNYSTVWDFLNEITDIIERIENNPDSVNLFRYSASKEELFFRWISILKSNVNYTEEFYKKIYKFVLDNNKRFIIAFLKFHSKIWNLEKSEEYLTQIMDLLEDRDNAKYIIRYLREFERLDEYETAKLFAKSENEKNENIFDFTLDDLTKNSVLENTEILWISDTFKNIKNYLAENDLILKEIKLVWKDNVFFLEALDWKKILFHNWKKIDFLSWLNVSWGKRLDFRDIYVWPNWELKWLVYVAWKWRIFKWSNILEKIWGKEYSDIKDVFIWPNWELHWRVEIDREWIIFKWNQLLENYYTGIYDDFHMWLDWEYRWIGEIEKESEDSFSSWYETVIIDWDKEIEKIWWERLSLNNMYFHTWPDWEYRWCMRSKLFIWDKLIDKIWGLSFSEVRFLNTLPNGEFVWVAEFYWKIRLFIWDKIIETIWWSEYDEITKLDILSNGEVVWIFRNKWDKKHFAGDILVEDFFTEKNDTTEEFIKNLLKKRPDKIITWEVSYWPGLTSFKYEKWNKTFKSEKFGFQQKTIQKKYNRKTENFVEFLCKWGEFLKEQENKVIFESDNELSLTELIWISRYFYEEIENLNNYKDSEQNQNISKIKELKQNISEILKNKIPYQRQITSTIDGQDRASMIWLREVVQNSRDAILKSRKNWKKAENIWDIDVDFYQNENKWISRITDNVWMSFYEVFKYLLTPWVSGKEWDETATWMFGQWFYSLVIWSQEIKIKTSVWDGKTTYVKLKPVYNDNKDIIDFDITYEQTEEQFSWTIIERVDESEWVWGNIWALVWINNLEKYVWNVDDVDISYNWVNIYNKENIKILESEEIAWLGTLSLKQNKDKEERLTKDNLFLSEIKNEYLDFLPDFIIKYIKENGYSIDLPKNIGLTKTRNAITDFEENLEILRPHIFNICTKHIVKEYLAWNISLPMMPLDYFGVDFYEMQFNYDSLKFADIVNNGSLLWKNEISKLQDKSLIIQFLINLKVENNWEIISIRDLKRRRDEEEFLKRHTQDDYVINHEAELRNSHKEIVNIDNDVEKEEFLEKVNKKFEKMFFRILGYVPKFWFAKWIWFNAFYGDWWIYFNEHYFEYHKIYENHELIRLITHEFTHLLEDFIKWYWIDFEEIINSWKTFQDLVWDRASIFGSSFWSHQKDLEHNHSFEKIQRDILKLMTRESL